MGAFLLGALSAALVALLVVYIRESAKWPGDGSPGDSPASPPASPLFPPAGDESFNDAFLNRVYALQGAVLGQPTPSVPQHFLRIPAFLELVGVMSDVKVPNEALDEFVMGEHAVAAWAALTALARRPLDEALEQRVMARLNVFHPFSRYFILRLLEAWRPDDPRLAGRVLLLLGSEWSNPQCAPVLDGFLARRAAVGPLSLEGLERPERFDKDILYGLLRDWTDPAVTQPLIAELEEEGAEAPPPAPPAPPAGQPQPPAPPGGDAHRSLGGIGRVTRPKDATGEGLLACPTADVQLERLLAALTGSPRRSALVVGEAGVGKSSLVRRAAASLSQQGWTIFEASAGQLNAGMMYTGALESRIAELVRSLRSRPRTLWVVPDFAQLLWAGRHSQSPLGALDMLVPAIEDGGVLMLSEARPAALERVLLEQPEVERLFEVVRLEPPSDAETAGMLERWAAAVTDAVVPPAIRTEAVALARQFLRAQPPPGAELRLLRDAVGLATGRAQGSASGQTRPEVGTDDLMEALARLTGLPRDILDERCELDLDAVRGRFEASVIGQPEAVDCLVDRLAMLKAGVTDPNRPTAVFLFVGGSGTGKTMLARTLAEYLFGSPDRLVRLDMSEMHGGQALDRLLGEPRDGKTMGNSLAERVRRQPFSVVLLDEFDRADPAVWQMFLQVFDAGRLTDRRGETADFRQTIIILTSNLGSATNEVRLGLVGGAGDAGPAGVQRAVERTFRPEFLNRLDRVVVFRPLTREVMRRILRKEVAEAFARRGLRRRDWAVEMEEGAVDLLVEHGFSPAHGARPLRRAVERLLLTPLAAAIVNRSAPEGDQFLFVRADGDQLAVEFVDPDAPAAVSAPAPAGAVGNDLAAIVYEARGGADEVEVLRLALLALRARVGGEAWAATKQSLLLESAAPGFWERPERFERLGRAEHMDRIESALRSAASLFERLQGGARAPRDAYPRDVVRRLAQTLYLLEAAYGEALETGPRDAFLSVEPSHDDAAPSDAARGFADRLAAMYEAWARARGMRLSVLAAPRGRDAAHVLAVSGFAAHRLLAPEAGLHVMESGEPGTKAGRATVRVRVEPQPAAPARDGLAGLRRQAEEALAPRGPLATTVVRRYREAPSPLVRDLVRCWRTGRIERVLGGDFDVIPVRE